MSDFRNRSVCVYDFGTFIEFAVKLTEYFGKVYYYSPWQSSFPKSSLMLVGQGIPGITRVNNFWDIVDKADLFCYDDKTEVLTDNGWKYFRDLEKYDNIATLNESKNILEWQKPYNYISYHHEGELISISNRKIDFAVTENHNMYVKLQYKNEYELLKAKNIFKKSNIEFKKSCQWIGHNVKYITIDSYEKKWEIKHVTNKNKEYIIPRSKTWKEKKYNAKDFCCLIGIWIAKGSIERRNGSPSSIEISQNEGTIADDIRFLLKKLSIKFTEKHNKKNTNISFRIHDAQLANYFNNYGMSSERKIIKYIKSLSSDLLKNLFEWYMKGDGAKTRNQFRTTSKKLSNDLQEICLKIGLYCTELKYPAIYRHYKNGKSYLCKEIYIITVGNNEKNHKHDYSSPCIRNKNLWKRIQYNGMVYCLTVKNHIIYVRRNGKTMWCGNCFPDICCGDVQVHLEKMGKRVWGSKKGEELEMFRDESKKYFKKIGIPVGHYEVVKGLAALRKYLKENKNQWIKVSTTRADTETFHSKNYLSVEPRLDMLEWKLGEQKKIKEFIVEDAIEPAVEIGSDSYCIDGKYPQGGITGIEVKDKGYLCSYKKSRQEFPKPVIEINDKLSKTLENYKYRNFISTELRVVKDGTPYLTDLCTRNGSPPNEIYIEMFENLADIIWQGSEGVLVEPKVKYKYGVELIIHSQWADKNWQAIQFPKELRKHFKFRNLTIIDGQYYVVPQDIGLPEVGAIVALGNTLEQAIDKCRELSEQIESYDLYTFPDVIDDARAEIEKLNSWGIKVEL